MAGGKNLGRQKIRMEKVQNPSHLNVTFSKRRAGLFKKGHELSVMCGGEVGLICFSPAGKPFSFGTPDLAHVMNRFENGGGSAIPNNELMIDLNTQLAQIESQLEGEREIGEAHDKSHKTDVSHCWLPAKNLNLASQEELQQLAKDIENLKLTVEATKLQAAKTTNNATNFLPFDLNESYCDNDGADPFAAGTSAAASSSGNYHGTEEYGFGPCGPF